MKAIAFFAALLLTVPALAASKQLPDGSVINAHDMACISHIVVDADAWVDHAYATLGKGAIEAKIDRWCPVYDARAAEQGQTYKNRAQRDAEKGAP